MSSNLGADNIAIFQVPEWRQSTRLAVIPES